VCDLLTQADDRDKTCGVVDAIASGHLAKVERKIADLAAVRDGLKRVIGSCQRDTVADGKIIETPGAARCSGRSVCSRVTL
jgi:MerR, DNA binding